MRSALVGVMLLTACTPAPTAATSTPSQPGAPATLTAPVAATPSSLPTSSFAVDAGAPWPVMLYEGDGSVVRQVTESGGKELARPCGQVVRLAARPAGLLAWCRGSMVDFADLRLISVPDGRVTVLASDTRAAWPADVSPDGRSVAAFRRGGCPPDAPVCQTRAVLVDVASKEEREIIPSSYPLGATLEWTALGLTFFQPECAESGCPGAGERGGTFVWDGSSFKRWSELRFVARAGEWTLLERLRSFAESARTVVVRGPRGEAAHAGHALGIASDGETLIWRPGTPAEQRGLLLRIAPDGRVVWQAELVGTVVKTVGMDAVLAVSPTNKIELYDLKRMLRFTPSLNSFTVAAVAR